MNVYPPNKAVSLSPDDVFELKLLRDRAERESQEAIIAGDGAIGVARTRFTDTAREAIHTKEMIERILKQL